MEYKCNLKQLTKISSDEGSGSSLSLCSSCKNSDCRNPIEFVSVSVFGINRKGRFFKSNSNFYSVTSCEGYQKEIKKEEEDE